jgi:hypothetical protein
MVDIIVHMNIEHAQCYQVLDLCYLQSEFPFAFTADR